jgi:hypothetical protein
MVESFSGTPDWYGGSEGIIKKLVERARDESLARYRPYGGERIAPFTPLQKSGFRLAEDEANNPRYTRIFGESGNAIRNALGEDISETISPYLQGATANPTENIDQYMHPYTERVVDQIATLGNRNLQENILPSVQNKFINAGQYGSTGHQNFTNRAVRDTAEGIAQAQGQALQGGYNTALQTAIGQQERQLQTGQLAGSTANQDIRNKLIGSEALQNLASNQQTQGLRGAAVLGQLGGQQQQQNQNQANTAYQEFQNERNYPFFQTARLNEIVRGLPVNTQQFANTSGPTPPQASPWTQGAGLLASAAGAYNQRPQGFAKGGAIKKLTAYRHYAEGGRSTPNPIQAGVNDAMDTAELKSMRDEANRLQTPQGDPFWASVARAGASIAANRQPGALAALGQGMQEGLNEYQGQLGNQDKRSLQSAKIMNLIDNTRRLQAERDRTHQLNLEKFGQHKKEFGMTHGVHQGQLGLAREKFEHEKKLYEGGKKGKAPNDYYKKSNESAIEEARKSLSTLPALKSNLNSLKKLADSLDTGPVRGTIAKGSSTVGSLLGMGKAEDIDNFDSLTNQLVLDLSNQLKGSTVALGKLKIIEQSKPQLTKVKGANQDIIKHMQDLVSLSEEKGRFLKKSLEKGVNALDVEDAFNQYADEKLDYEEKEGKKFPNKPSDFLEGMEFEKGIETAPISSEETDIQSMSDEQLRKIAGE